ncbi:IucA/IucC family C-terminal-domain containing protein [Priestia flexa]|uniref:IucA/IucC family C-terminal-domain containing protein n=1 Tax=Priestia flexa TaxID=86664 RepID=UPI0024BF8C51|nr:IucA/IucC family C-terminal-domain containing protein [Priestia flexa]WHX78873.1 IucA/IucC family C-terminal-domain containing protein [Priestia flexa]
MLNKKEQQALAEKFRATFIQTSAYEMKIADLADERKMESALSFVQDKIEAPNLRVVASIFAKRLGFVAAGCLYAFSVCQKRVDVQRLSLQAECEDDGLWLPQVYYPEQAITQVDVANRNEERKEIVTELLSEGFESIWNPLNQYTGISKRVLWENIAVYLLWLYDQLKKDNNVNQLQLEDDFTYLFYEAAGNQFGQYEVNPLRCYTRAKSRQTCCLSYQLAGKKKYCKSCPILCRAQDKEAPIYG